MFTGSELENPALAGGQELVPVNAVPLTRFENNVAFAAWNGLETWYLNRNMSDGRSVIDNLTVWNVSSMGVFLEYTGHLTFKDGLLVGLDFEGTEGILPGTATHDIEFNNVHIENFDIGLRAPVRGSNKLVGGHFIHGCATNEPRC